MSVTARYATLRRGGYRTSALGWGQYGIAPRRALQCAPDDFHLSPLRAAAWRSGGAGERALQPLEDGIVKQLLELDPDPLVLDPHDPGGLEAQSFELDQDALVRLGRPGDAVDHAADRRDVEHGEFGFHARLRATPGFHAAASPSRRQTVTHQQAFGEVSSPRLEKTG